MNVEKQLAENAAKTEQELVRLTSESDADFAPVLEALRYSLLAPRAKRIRPALVLEFCRLFGGEDQAALPAAAAVEMVHTYSLIHDDLPCMDNDDLRRGRPTCHVAHGEATALLAGDALLTYAFEVLAQNAAMGDRAVREAVLTLSSLAGVFGMIGGQIIDLAGEKRKLPEELLLKLHNNKTGALMVASATLGCLAAGLTLSDPRTMAARRYAKGIGLAFQIVDDVIDATTDSETAGKSVGSDEKQNKTTFLCYYTPKEALAYAKRVTDAAKAEISSYEGSEFLQALADKLIERKF
ncbi:MAG: polyprenyl synthetase family protein [Ruminococcaceae bacterium]|nr:polyprenyl synthetase family protein [Oscillospiraceae bacterium]MBQ2772977.1 polyprenyl synthetase family protein [Clostridia bacterium]